MSARAGCRRPIAAGLAVLVGLIAIATSSARRGPVMATAPRGRALIAYAHTLAMRELATGGEQTVVRLTNNDFVRSPHWLPGGRGILYVDQLIYAGDPAADYGSDIWRVDPDGSNPRRLFVHSAIGADIDRLSVANDGTFLLFGYVLTAFDTAGLPTGQTLQVLRLDLNSLQTTIVADQAEDPAVSPDGRTVAYLDVSHADDDQFGLWVASLDANGGQPAVTVGQGFLSFFAPHFSPDGRTLLFAAARANVASGGTPGLSWQDGPPQDIWTVRVDGSGLTRLTNLAEDQPSASWSADGSQVLVIGQTGLYMVAADGSGMTRLGDGYLHSELSWLDQ